MESCSLANVEEEEEEASAAARGGGGESGTKERGGEEMSLSGDTRGELVVGCATKAR